MPVVAFDIGGLADIFENQQTGFLVIPVNTRSFAERLALILSDEFKWHQISLVTRESTFRKFAGPVVANAYAELYERFLAGVTSPHS